MKFPINWSDERVISRAFAYATRTGIGLRMPMPIGWYQIHQCAALDELERRGSLAVGREISPASHPLSIRLRNGQFEARTSGPWRTCGTPSEIFNAADENCHRIGLASYGRADVRARG